MGQLQCAEMLRVLDCSVHACSDNSDNLGSAAAITVGSGPAAACTTFIPLGVTGGLDRATAFVGACSKEACLHNTRLECTASAVRVGADSAECPTTGRAETAVALRPSPGVALERGEEAAQ